jgi:hypothetical protein
MITDEEIKRLRLSPKLDLPTREHKIVAFVDALDEYVRAKIDYEQHRESYGCLKTQQAAGDRLQDSLRELLK